MNTVAVPEQISCLRQTRKLHISFGAAGNYQLSFAALRAHSPAAGGSRPLSDCADIEIIALEPVGNYAVRPRFSDGHATGIYTWPYLLELCQTAGIRL